MPGYVFDGFCERPFNPETDGWMNEMPDINDYPAVQNAKDVLCLFEELKAARKENWQLRQNAERLKTLVSGYTG